MIVVKLMNDCSKNLYFASVIFCTSLVLFHRARTAN